MPLSTSDTIATSAQETADGTLVGRNATSKVGFFGATPVVQPAAISLSTGTVAQVVTALAAMGLLKSTA